jgi:transcriptional regulator with XRE-family HTH domain
MAGDAGSPTVRRRELGALLRAMRTEAGMTVEQVAEALLVSPSKISRLETGQRGASPRDIRDLCNLYGVTDAGQRDHLATLAREGKEQAWWQPYDLPYATYVGLEAEATSISDFDSVIPGLLQIPAYARAIHEGAMPRLSSAVIGQRIEVRNTRQAILRRDDPPRFSAVVDEAALHRVVGGPAVMAAQLDHIVDVCDLANVSVQVVPYSAGAHPALDSKFILLEFTPPAPGVVYVEGLVGQMYLEKPQDVARYTQIFERLKTLALSQQETADLLAKLSNAFRTG